MQKITHIFKALSTKIKSIQHSTPNAVIIGAIIIACSIVAHGFIVRGTSTTNEIATYFTGKVPDATDYIEGNADSDVFIVEYSDTECPYCVQLHGTMKELRTAYEKKVGFIYRHFPLTSIHPNAFEEGRAIECAGKVGGTKKYYEYVDALFGYKLANQTTALPQGAKDDIAKGINLNFESFTACMKDQTSSDAINAAIGDGINAGVEGTPATFILAKTKNGYEVVASISGARPFEYFQAAIEQALNK